MSLIDKKSFFLVVILCIIAMAGCGSNSQDDKITDPENDLIEGWQEYDSGSYESAILTFEKVLNNSPSSEIAGDTYNGLGWAYLNISQSAGVNQVNINNALDKFNEAVNHDKTNSDAWIGQGCALLIKRNSSSDLQNALKSIDNAQQEKDKYLYRHDYDSEADIYALKAQCYYYLGRFDDAQKEIGYTLAIEKDNNIALAIKDLIDF